MFDQTCTNCGQRFSRNANFCPFCGAAAGRGSVNCRFCGKEMPAVAQFCPHCGKSTEGSQRPAMVSNTWAREPNDFATRIEIDDLEGTLQRNLIVEPGTQAIILIDGRNLVGTVGPGRYTLRTFADKLTLPSLRTRATALLVDTGEVDLALTVNDVYTSDPLKIALDCHLAVGVVGPLAFFTNLLKGGRSYSLDQLKAYLYDEIQDAAQECVGAQSAASLHANLAHKQEFATHIAAHLDETLRQTGLGFSRVRTMNFRHARWNELTQQQEEYFLQLSKEEADLAQRKRMFDVLDQGEVQSLIEETRKLEHNEQRVQLRERMRRAVLSDKFSELTTGQEMERFLRDLDRQKLIADDEWDRVQRTIQSQRDDELWTRRLAEEDRERARAHLVARLKLENDYELKQIELLQRSDLSEAELDFQLKLERQRVEGEQTLEARRQEFRLEQTKQQAAFDREQTQLDAILRREQQMQDEQQRLNLALQNARATADINNIEREQDRLDMELGLLALEKMKAVRRKDDEERELLRLKTRREEMEIDLAAEEVRLRLRLTEAQAAFDQQMALEAQAQKHELDRMERLKDLSPAAVVAVSGVDQGRIVADMQRTEAMKGMTEQQILAMAATNSPEAARALAEIAKAATEGKLAQEQVAMYERLIEQNKAALEARDKAAQQVTDAYKDAAQKTQDMAVKALDSQREGMVEIAKATSHPPAAQQPPTVVVTGSGGAPMAIGGAPGMGPLGETIVCRRCGTRALVGTRFCTNCGYEFFVTGGEGESPKK